MPPDIDAGSVSITDAGGLRVQWQPEDHVSDYDSDWLRGHRGETDDRSCSGPALATWGAELSKGMPSADYGAVTSSGDALLDWLRLLRDFGVAVLRNTPREPLTVLALAHLIGPARATNFGEHFDVVSKHEPNSNAYTALGLLCHTDLPNWERPPDYQLLHCLENDAEGGDSILVDGFQAAETLYQREPAAFRLLSQSPIDFHFQDRESDIRFRAPTIALDEAGAVTEIRFNFAVMDAIDAPAKRMGLLCRALRTFAAVIREPALECRYRLKPGELLIFDNRRVLHGRAAFDPATGGRHLQGCYVDRDQLLSRIRVLERSTPLQ